MSNEVIDVNERQTFDLLCFVGVCDISVDILCTDPHFNHLSPLHPTHHFLTTHINLPFSQSHLSTTCEMSDQPGSSRFRTLFEAALQQYEMQTEISLAKHPLAEQLQNCDSVNSVIAVLQEQVQAFSEFRGSDRIMKSLMGVVSVLSTLSSVADLSDSIGLVRWKAPIGCPMF